MSRRGSQAETGRIDVEAMAYNLGAYLPGDRGVCRAVVVPSPEQEDAERLSRERTQLTAEKNRHTNRIRGRLALHGTREVKGLCWGGEGAEAPGGLKSGDGRGLGGHLRAGIAREFERLHLVLRHMRALDADRQAALTQEASAFPRCRKVGVLSRLAGVGPITATALAGECSAAAFRRR